MDEIATGSESGFTDNEGNEVKPPSGNTGAEISCLGRSIRLDYLAATLLGEPVSDALETVEGLFGKITSRDMGWHGYSNSGGVLAGFGVVAWHYERPDMGVHIDLSAKGLAEIPRLVNGDILGLLCYLKDRGFKYTRVDLAFDDVDGALDLGVIWEALHAGDVACRWKRTNFKRIHGVTKAAGETIFLGSRKSNVVVRIYDKAAEQGIEDHHWIRVEIELKDKRAGAMVDKLLEDGPTAALAVLRSCLEFKEAGTEGNITRRKPAVWWVAFLDGIEKSRLSLPPETRSLEKVRKWLFRQVAPSVALVSRAEGGGVDWLYALLKEGDERLKPDQLALISEQQEEVNMQ